MKVGVDRFGGLIPRRSARLLPAEAAQAAVNTRLLSGDLEPWSDAVVEQSVLAGAQSIFRYQNSQWFAWAADVDAVEAPIADDVDATVYFTGTDKPRLTTNSLALGDGNLPVNSYQLGIPAPGSAPSLGKSGTATEDDPALADTRAYVVTFVSIYGEEGPPSPPTDNSNIFPGETAELSGIPAPPAGEYDIAEKRIYRTATSGSSTAFQFVDAIAAGTSAYSDTVETEALGEILPSIDWVAPPAGMTGLVAMPNGILAGFEGKDVLISEQYLPHAWPFDYRHSTDEPIVGLGVVDASLAVLTEEYPYLITGASPASLSMAKLDAYPYACASKRGIATLPGLGVVYPSPDGLIALRPGNIRNLTEELMTRREWQAYAPDSMLGSVYDGRYFGFFDTGTAQGCLVFDPGEQTAALYELGLNAQGAFYEALTDTLYLIDSDDQIVAWDRGAAPFAAYRWRSKVWQLPYPAVLAAARVRAETYTDLTLTVFVDGAQVADVAVTDGAFRLPIGQRGRHWVAELSGTDRVYDLQLAETVAELD